jgi:hypothetical protein
MGNFQKFWQFQKVINLMPNRARYENTGQQRVSLNHLQNEIDFELQSFVASIRWKSYCIGT